MIKIPNVQDLARSVIAFLEITEAPPDTLRLDCDENGWHLARRPWGPVWGKHFHIQIPSDPDCGNDELAFNLANALIAGVRMQLERGELPNALEHLTEMFAEAGISYKVVEESPGTFLGTGDTWVTVDNRVHRVHFMFKHGKLENMGVESK